MRRIAVLSAVALLVGVVATFAQGADFAGTWVLDKDRSDDPQAMRGGGGGGGRGGGGGGGRGGGRGGGMMLMPATLVITQSEAELIVEHQSGDRSRTFTYLLDGTESTNAGPRGDIVSSSHWDGGQLISEGSQTVSTPRGEFTLETREVRSLSEDGQTMTIVTTRTTPRGDRTLTLVYQRSTT